MNLREIILFSSPSSVRHSILNREFTLPKSYTTQSKLPKESRSSVLEVKVPEPRRWIESLCLLPTSLHRSPAPSLWVLLTTYSRCCGNFEEPFSSWLDLLLLTIFSMALHYWPDQIWALRPRCLLQWHKTDAEHTT